MADDDEIDVLGDFSFNSCFAQNNQGIPSCSNREDTVHPQWLLDSTETNWYDKQNKAGLSDKSGPSRKLFGYRAMDKHNIDEPTNDTAWSQTERELLVKEMTKYGRNVRKISQTIKTKTDAEIQALIEAEYGVHLETAPFTLEKYEDQEDIPTVVQEEIVADDANDKLKICDTPIITVPKHPFRKKTYKAKSKHSLLKPDALMDKCELVNPSEIFYEDELMIGSTESIGSDLDLTDIVSKNIIKYQAKAKGEKKAGNHRRKVSRNYDKGRIVNKSKDMVKSPQRRQRKDSSLSEDSVKSPKMQIVLGSGLALPVSEGEQVIKIEKKKDSEPESDIEIDVDSENEDNKNKVKKPEVEIPRSVTEEAPVAVPLRKFEPMPRRQKKINLDGGGGYTIMHTAAGDLYEVGTEPRRERQPKKQPIHLIQCRVYNAEKPAPYEVRFHVSTLILMDAHAHTSRGEVMGLMGGEVMRWEGGGETVLVRAYRAAAAAACSTHCDMDPVSQSRAAEQLVSAGLRVCGWHHSHPVFPPAPSALDLRTQRALQAAGRRAPLLGVITSQHWPAGRSASQYRCIRTEDQEDDSDIPTGYQFSVKLVPDLTEDTLPSFLMELRTLLRDDNCRNEYSVDMAKDICPQAKMTYLEKCISSISHHMRSAGYPDHDPITEKLIKGLRDIFR